jgi:hypothetical protein
MPTPLEPDDYLSLLPFCKTNRQAEAIHALANASSQRDAAQKMGITRSNLQKKLAQVRAYAERQGWNPDRGFVHPVSSAEVLKGHSTLYRFPEGDPEGRVLRWVKGQAEYDRTSELLKSYADELAQDLPKQKPKPAPSIAHQSNLLTQFTLTDYHIGMKAWHEETGEDWDIAIAQDLMIDWFRAAIQQSPDSDVAIFAQLGDFLHWDGLEAVTPTNRFVLDADTRWQKLVRVSARCAKAVIDMLLDRFPRVHVLMAEGNHDMASSSWLSTMFTMLYEDEPRLTVEQSPKVYYAYQWGNTALFYHHGHKKPLKRLDQVLASEFRGIYGQCTHVYAHTGHLHHQVVLETPLMKLEQHPTLAAPDAHAARGGWLSKRGASAITYHKEFGEVARVTITPEMVSNDKAKGRRT